MKGLGWCWEAASIKPELECSVIGLILVDVVSASNEYIVSRRCVSNAQ